MQIDGKFVLVSATKNWSSEHGSFAVAAIDEFRHTPDGRLRITDNSGMGGS